MKVVTFQQSVAIETDDGQLIPLPFDIGYDLHTKLEQLQAFVDSYECMVEMTNISCEDGTWDHDPYLHGFANGMIYAKSLVDGHDPTFLDAPKTWGKDKKDQFKGVLEGTEQYKPIGNTVKNLEISLQQQRLKAMTKPKKTNRVIEYERLKR